MVTLVTLIYAAACLFVRWHLIAYPTRLAIHSQIRDMRMRLDMEPLGDAEKQRKIAHLKDILAGAAQRLDHIEFLDRILWTRGQEFANWCNVNEVENELTIMQPAGTVKARLAVAEQELRQMSTGEAGALADLIHKELAGHPSDDRIRSLRNSSGPRLT